MKRWVSRRRGESAPTTGAGERAPGAGLVVARNALYNFGSQIWLTLIALVATPYIVHQLGVDGYGLYALLLTVVGYFAFLDLGLGVATVKYLSEYHGRESDDVIRRLIGTTVALYLVLGALGGAVLALSASWLVAHVLAVPEDLESLARTSLWIVAVGFVLNLPSVAFMSVPLALQRMDITGRRNALVGTATIVGTVLVLWLGRGLEEVLVVHVGVGFTATVSWIVTARRLLPATPLTPRLDVAMLRRLTRFGSLKFLQHVATHSVYHLDKLLLGVLASLAAVAYYTVPLALAHRVVYAVGNVSNAFFPAASQLHGGRELERLRELYVRSMKLVAVLVVPAASILFIFSHEILEFWIDSEFANESSTVLRLLALAYAFVALSSLPGVTADAAGRPGATAAFSVLALILNLALALVLIPRWEAAGAATAIALNACVQVPLFMYWVHSRVLNLGVADLVRRSLGRPVLAGVCSWPLMVLPAASVDSLASLLAALAAAFVVYLLLTVVFQTFDRRDREAIRGVLLPRRA
jgi:O-antigen/teichoic acid export membrane protein